jgi:hypothetical protein
MWMHQKDSRLDIVGRDGDQLLIVFPFEKLEAVKAVLDQRKFGYHVDEEVLSIDDGPEKAFITLWHRIPRKELRQYLDEVSLHSREASHEGRFIRSFRIEKSPLDLQENPHMTESPLEKIHLIGEGDVDDYLIMLPYEKLEAVKAALDAWKLRYYVDEEVLSINNGPESAFITLWDKVAKDKLQDYLDNAILSSRSPV